MKLSLWQKVLIGMVVGAICGHFLQDFHQYAKPFATIYTNLIYMVVVPTVFFAILYGITNISDTATLGRVSFKASIMYTIATLLAVAIGISFALFFKPGLGLSLFEHPAMQGAVNLFSSDQKTLQEIVVNMFPTNPINAMAMGNTLQIVVFALVLGVALILVGEKANEAKKVIVSVASVIFKMVELVVRITPYGAFAIMFWIVGEYGFSTALSLGKLILVILAAFSVQYILFGAMLLLLGLNPIKFYRKTLYTQSVAFATSSSKATITTAIHDLQENLGVSNRIAGFILPLGATINMTGTAIYIAACALFFAQVAGIELTKYQYAILVITSTIGSIGAAGYPSGGVIMLSMVLTSIGLPTAGLPLIMGIDRFVDMFRTVVNVTGDCAITVAVDKVEHTLDTRKYDA